MKQFNENIVDIQDCFEYDKKIEIFSGDNSMYCDICKKCTNCSMKTVLYTLPKILIIILNRGLGMQFKVKLEFGENLNLNNYAKNDGGVYELICVLTHFGESRMNGRFIAACKSPIDNRWYKYNDEMVFNVKDFNSEILNIGNPYILFYKMK